MKKNVVSTSQLDRIHKALISPSHKLLFGILRFTGARVMSVSSLRVCDVYDEKFHPLDFITFVNGVHEPLQVPVVPRLTEPVPALNCPPLSTMICDTPLDVVVLPFKLPVVMLKTPPLKTRIVVVLLVASMNEKNAFFVTSLFSTE